MTAAEPNPFPAARRDPGPELLGTRLRHLLDQLDQAAAAAYTDLGLEGFRPRYTPIVRILAADGPASVRALAAATGVTHSAASQTLAQLAKDGLVLLAPGTTDGRERIAHLTDRAREVLPLLEVEWNATLTAARELESELSFPMSALVGEMLAALERRPMRERIADADPRLAAPDRPAGAAAGT